MTKQIKELDGFDYEILHRCQYEIGGGDCGEPATHKVWWDDYGRDAMLVCQQHFNFIRFVEEGSNVQTD